MNNITDGTAKNHLFFKYYITEEFKKNKPRAWNILKNIFYILPERPNTDEDKEQKLKFISNINYESKITILSFGNYAMSIYAEQFERRKNISNFLYNLINLISNKNNTYLYFYDFTIAMKYFRGHYQTINTQEHNEMLSAFKFDISNDVEQKLNNGAKIVLVSWDWLRGSMFDWDGFFKIVKRPPTDFILITSDASLCSHKYVPTIYDQLHERKYSSSVAFTHYLGLHSKLNMLRNKQIPRWYGLNLNYRTKPTRTYICKFFDENFKDKINYSYNIVDIDDIGVNVVSGIYSGSYRIKNPEKEIIINNYNNWARKHGNKSAEGDIELSSSADTLDKYTMVDNSYLNSFFNIVSEAFSEFEDSPMLSEKTFKPIFWYQPFIIIGQKNSIKQLKDLGYDVFEDIIDHSYDSKDHIFERLELIKKEIIRLCSISKDDWADMLYERIPRLTYNFFHLINTSKNLNKNPLFKGKYITI